MTCACEDLKIERLWNTKIFPVSALIVAKTFQRTTPQTL